MATYSALPANLNLALTVGDDFTLSLTVTENGSPWVATGATLATDIIDSSGAVVATDFTTAASTGTVTLSLTDTQTGTLGVGVYSYRLSVTKSSLTRDWIAGTLSIVEAGVGGSSTSSASLSITNGTVTLGITSTSGLASNITVADSGGFYTGTDVEAVLQELPTKFAPLAGDTPYPLTPDITMHAHAMASGHGWGAATAYGTYDFNYTADYDRGTQSVRMTSTTSAGDLTIEKLSIPAFSLVNRTPVVWFKIVDGIEYCNGVRLLIGSGSNWSNYAYTTMADSTVDQTYSRIQEGEWYRLTVPYREVFTNGTFDAANVTRFRFQVNALGGGVVDVLFQGVGSQPESTTYPNGVVSFTFDDGYKSVITKAAPMMDIYGWSGAAYIIADLITDGSPTSMSLDDLYALERKGWDIGAHSYRAAVHNATGGLTGVTLAEVATDMAQIREWLQRYGFKSSEHFAYPQGYWNADILDEMRKWYTAALTTRGDGVEAIRPGEPLKIGRLFTNTLADNKARVDYVVANGGWQVFGLHKIDTASGTLTMAEADFAELLAYCQTTGVAVKTVSEVINSVR